MVEAFQAYGASFNIYLEDERQDGEMFFCDKLYISEYSRKVMEIKVWTRNVTDGYILEQSWN